MIENNLTKLISEFQDNLWNWCKISKNPNITWAIISSNPDKLGIGIVYLKIKIRLRPTKLRID